jgi:hypothetical protein
MSKEHSAEHETDQPMIYQIKIKGHLGHRWADWFEGLTVTLEENGDTLLTGILVDQAALYGLLKRVRDLGVSLLSVNAVGAPPTDAPGAKEGQAGIS